MAEGKYKENSLRVREIYGIDAHDKRYNIHHNIQKSDYRSKKQKEFLNASVPSGRFDLDAISNLTPLKIEVHADLHRRLELLEGTISPIRRRKKEKRLRVKKRHLH